MTKKKQPVAIAGQQYDPADGGDESFVYEALSETREQVSDVYAEGTVEAAVNQENGSNIPLSQE
ncbi:YozQ family protein [Geobacillus vulcani]|uniref:YozQ family protein n=1 Tax=Geobacillus vulcani TaxID=135517 RepID=UPI0004DF3472|nr:YozQ family protein [Geobacillus vulcani]